MDENIKKYKIEVGVVKPHHTHLNNFININELSSLNVSKSFKKMGDNSPELSSL